MVAAAAVPTPATNQRRGPLGLIQTLILSRVVTNYVRITTAELAKKRQATILVTKRMQPEPIPWAAV